MRSVNIYLKEDHCCANAMQHEEPVHFRQEQLEAGNMISVKGRETLMSAFTRFSPEI